MNKYRMTSEYIKSLYKFHVVNLGGSVLGHDLQNGDLIAFEDAHDLFPVATAAGYNYFRVKEGRGDMSIAITDPSIIHIVKNEEVKK